MKKLQETDIKRIIEGVISPTAKNKNIQYLPMNEHNKAILTGFNRHMAGIQGLSLIRRVHVIAFLRRWVTTLMNDLEFHKIGNERLQEWVIGLNQRDTTDNTRVFQKAIITKFFRWLYTEHLKMANSDDILKELIGWLKVHSNGKSNDKKFRKPQKDFTAIFEDEMPKLLPFCISYGSRDKCLIYVLWETTYRSSEFLSLNIEDVKFNKEQQKYYIKHPDLRKSVPLHKSDKYLKEWLFDHPQKDDPHAPLWVTTEGKRMAYVTLYKLTTKIGKRAGFKKITRPHCFRSGGLCFHATYMPLPQLREVAGHSPNSPVTEKYYLQVREKDIDNTVAKHHGITDKLEDGDPIQKMIQCSACNEYNSHDSNWCSNCSEPLSDMALKRHEENLKREEDLKSYVNETVINATLEMRNGLIELTDMIRNDLKNEVITNSLTGERFRPREWYMENWNVDPAELDIKCKIITNMRDRSGRPLRNWAESDVLPFKKTSALFPFIKKDGK